MPTQQYATSQNPAYKRRKYLEAINAQAPLLFGQKQAEWDRGMAEKEAQLEKDRFALEQRQAKVENRWATKNYELAKTGAQADMGMQALGMVTPMLGSDAAKMTYGDAWDKGKKKVKGALGIGTPSTYGPGAVNPRSSYSMGGPNTPAARTPTATAAKPGFFSNMSSNLTLGNTLGAAGMGFGVGNLAPAMGIKNKYLSGGLGALAGGLTGLFSGSGGPWGAGVGALFGGLGGLF